MTNSKKVEIAKSFVGMHKDSDIENWCLTFIGSDEQKLELIYDHLVDGVYGEVRPEGSDDLQIEIGGFQSKSGYSELFDFEKVD